ncbi:peptidase G2 autoproteolytic cleavage domain-containing protein [Ruminococcus sp.]|uniref:peptidase G2 autoproteolytic cleavage domain-containing protein n=1 Tax=Ruminococcus sp. TaxID=41978 RepID=UPI003967C8D1
MSKMNKLIKESQDNKKTLGYTYGTVKSYDSTNCTAIVSLLEYNGAEKSFLNKSGEILSMGDSVWIYFRGGGINAGYIAIRNGKPIPLGSKNSNIGRFVEYVDSNGYHHISEKFNYYGNSYYLENIAHGDYNHVEGQANHCYEYSYDSNNYIDFSEMKIRNIPYFRENSSLNSLTGFNNTSVGGCSNHVSGMWNMSEYSVAVDCSGAKNTISNSRNTYVSGVNNILEGVADSIVVGTLNIVKGDKTKDQMAKYNAVFGYHNEILNYDRCLVAGAWNHATANNQTVIGVNAKSTYQSSENADILFNIGNGQEKDGTLIQNSAMQVDFSGNVYAGGAYKTNGADYAEYFEWLDGNVDNQDRIGLFVTLDGDKIKLANKDDYILGVISANPSIVGNSAELDWHDKYKTDVYGRLIYDESHNPIVSKNYNDTLEYVPRGARKEYSKVGLLGQLVVQDDGTCEVNGYCTASVNGVATKSDSGYRVIKRIDETHIKIILK